MKIPSRVTYGALLLLLTTTVSGCSFFKDVKELTHALSHPKESKQSQKPAEPAHEAPLLDNKVTALRVQAAL